LTRYGYRKYLTFSIGYENEDENDDVYIQ